MVHGTLDRPARRLDLEVLVSLRIGAYQLRFMSGVAPHAAVTESVELAKRARKRSAAGLVNAVLRRLPPRPRRLEGARLSHPEWLVKRWKAEFGKQACDALLLANLARPPAYLRIPPPYDPRDALERLRLAGASARVTDLPRALRLTSGSPRTVRRALGKRARIQDINSQRVATLLADGKTSSVLDVCAAPGGKARVLSESAAVVAGDRSVGRLRLTKRLGRRGLHLLAMDAERPLPFTRPFERVLVDAPCSGTGTLSRNPDIKWRLRPSDIADLSQRQERILARSMDAVAPGGTLLYSTCSLEPEENKDVVAAAIRDNPGWTAERALATVPGKDAGDGFQAWRMRRPPD